MNNRSSMFIVAGLIILAGIGLVSGLLKNPAGILKMVAVVALIVAVLYFAIGRFSSSGPGKQQQRAFHKAAIRSKKKYQSKEANTYSKRSKIRSLASARRKKDASHLTVIEGKKGKKKNRASF
nr:SA1362 family protein [Bacillus sp. REN3]